MKNKPPMRVFKHPKHGLCVRLADFLVDGFTKAFPKAYEVKIYVDGHEGPWDGYYLAWVVPTKAEFIFYAWGIKASQITPPTPGFTMGPVHYESHAYLADAEWYYERGSGYC